MITVTTIRQLINNAVGPLKLRARGMVRRAFMNALSNDGGLATGQFELSQDEQVDSVEVINPPGLSFRPEGAEALVLAVGGDPSNLVAIPWVRGQRLTGDDLAAGEVALHIGNAGQLVRLKANGDVVVSPGAGGKVYLGEDAATKRVALAEDVDAALSKLQAAYDGHTHPTAPVGPVSTPTIVPTVSPVGPLASTAATLVHAK